MTRNTGTRPFAVFAALVVATPAFAHPDTGDFVQSAFLEAPEIAAEELGVTEEALRGALPPPPNQQVPSFSNRSPT